jgi:PAS domain-containing protein
MPFYGSDGEIAGVAGIDLFINHLDEFIAGAQIGQTGQAFILNEKGRIIISSYDEHDGDETFIRENLLESPDEATRNVAASMIRGETGIKRVIVGGTERFIAYHRMEAMPWSFAVVIDVEEVIRSALNSEQNIFNMNQSALSSIDRIITVVGIAAMVIFLIAIAGNILLSRRLTDAEERVKLMLDSTPLCCELWDENFNVIDCNNAAVRVYRLKDKQEYIDRFSELSPEYQPDGQRSDEKAKMLVKKAFDENGFTFEWMNQLLDGTPIPEEVTLVPVNYGNSRVIAAYSRDLREHYKMMEEIKAATERNIVVTEASPVAYILCKKDLSPIDCNNEAVRLFDCSSKQVFLDNYFKL